MKEKFYSTFSFFFFLALLETRDINLYLKPLETYFQEIETLEFKEILPKIKILLHCVCLMWANSRFYTLERIIALLREISNLIISQVHLTRVI